MSFSYSVKEELAGIESRGRHCRIAELAAFYAFSGSADADADEDTLRFWTDQPLQQGRVFTLLRKTFKIDSCVIVGRHGGTADISSVIRITDPEEARAVRMVLKVRDAEDAVQRICERSCCARAFIRGAFEAAGSVSDPEKSYHFEIVCPSEETAQVILCLTKRFDIEARTVLRKGRRVVYVKEGTQIVDLLNIMGAHTSLMEMENIRIVKDVRNRVNRQVNCETANLSKTVNASVRQIGEIRMLEQTGRLKGLPQPLQETAMLRLAHPDASLRELGEMHDPPIGRSGVNHRLKKIGEIASDAAALKVGNQKPQQQVSEIMEET